MKEQKGGRSFGRWVWVLGAATGIGVALLVVFSLRNVAAESVRTKAVPSDENVQRELSELRNAVRDLKTSAPARSEARGVASSPEPREAEADAVEKPQPIPLDAEELDAEATVRFLEHRDLLDKTWSSEERDPDWSGDATRSLGDRYFAEEFAGVDAKTDCRWSMCRIDLKFAEGQNVEQLGRRAGMGFPWPAQAFFHFDPENRTGVYYVARENYELPAMMTQ